MSDSTKHQSTAFKCPDCLGTKFARKYAGFFAEVDENGDDTADNFSEHESCTELTEEAICLGCGHEFEWES